MTNGKKGTKKNSDTLLSEVNQYIEMLNEYHEKLRALIEMKWLGINSSIVRALEMTMNHNLAYQVHKADYSTAEMFGFKTLINHPLKYEIKLVSELPTENNELMIPQKTNDFSQDLKALGWLNRKINGSTIKSIEQHIDKAKLSEYQLNQLIKIVEEITRIDSILIEDLRCINDLMDKEIDKVKTSMSSLELRVAIQEFNDRQDVQSPITGGVLPCAASLELYASQIAEDANFDNAEQTSTGFEGVVLPSLSEIGMKGQARPVA